MESLKEDLYSAAFRKWEISPSSKTHAYRPEGALRTFENEFGEGGSTGLTFAETSSRSIPLIAYR